MKYNLSGLYGLSSSVFGGKLDQREYFRIRAAGFTLMELCMKGNGDFDNADWLGKQKKLMEAEGISPWSVHIPFGWDIDPSAPDEDKRRKVEAKYLGFFDEACEAEPKYAVFHLSSEPIGDDEREAHKQSLRRTLSALSEKAKRCGFVIAAEVLPRSCLGNCSTELLSLIEGFENVKICFDVNHLLKESHSDFIAKTKGRVVTTHLSDYDFIDERHLIPGNGKIDWQGLYSELDASGCKAPHIFEVRGAGFTEDEDRAVAIMRAERAINGEK